MLKGSNPNFFSCPIMFNSFPYTTVFRVNFSSQLQIASTLSFESNFYGQKASDQIGWFPLWASKSLPPILSQSKTFPLYKPIAKIYPSGDQSQHIPLSAKSCLVTLLWSKVQIPKSLSDIDASEFSTGLYASARIFPLCEYLSSPSLFAPQITTVLSLEPVANHCPSREYAIQLTTSLWPLT